VLLPIDGQNHGHKFHPRCDSGLRLIPGVAGRNKRDADEDGTARRHLPEEVSAGQLIIIGGNARIAIVVHGTSLFSAAGFEVTRVSDVNDVPPVLCRESSLISATGLAPFPFLKLTT
jgi:hypothetical protein